MTIEHLWKLRKCCSDDSSFVHMLRIVDDLVPGACMPVHTSALGAADKTSHSRNAVAADQSAVSTPSAITPRATFIEWSCGREFRPVFISASFDSLTGYHGRDCLSGELQFWNIIVAEDRIRYFSAIHQLLYTGLERCKIAYRIRIKNGGLRFIDEELFAGASDGEDSLTIYSTLTLATAYRQSAADLRTTVDHSDEGICLLDAEGRILDLNPAMRDILALPQGRVECPKLGDLLKGDAQTIYRGLLRSAMEKHGARSGELTIHHPGDAAFDCRFTLHTLASDGAGAMKMILFARRLTEMRLVQHALMKSERDFKLLFENSHNGVFILHTFSHEILDINASACRMLGKRKSDLLGLPLLHLSPQAGKDLPLLNSEPNKNSTIHFKTTQYGRGGRELTLNVTASVLRYNGRPAFLCVAEDISAEEHLRELRMRDKRLQQAMEHAGHGLLYFDAGCSIRHSNAVLCRTLGYTSGELKFRTLRDLVHPDDQAAIQALQHEILESSGGKMHLEIRLLDKAGRTVWTRCAFSSLTQEGDDKPQAIAIVQNINELKSVKSDLQQRQAQVQEQSILTTELITQLQYDLRTTLNGILGFSSVLVRELGSDALLSAANNIHASAEQMLTRIGNIGALALLDSGVEFLNFVNFAPADEIEEVITHYHPAAERKGLKLIMNDASQQKRILADPDTFKLLLGNLIENAIKHTGQGCVSIDLQCMTAGEKPRLQISVRDSGVGISPARLARVFENNLRDAGQRKSDLREAELGLTVLQRLTAKMFGSLHIDSIVGNGTVVNMSFPVVETQLQRFQRQTPLQSAARFSTERPKILLVEDDRVGQELVSHFVKDLCTTDIASDGDKALGLCQRNSYDVVLMDINLGKRSMDGVDTLRRMRQIEGYHKTPAIAVTAFAMHDDREKYLSEGFCDYIAKPFNRKRLMESLAGILGQVPVC